jgi:hypothetical protein
LPTRRYTTLSGRLNVLQRHFVPPVKVAGNYSAAEIDKTRAYIVLAHAEIESYLEDMTTSVLDAAKRRWQTGQSAGRCVSALFMYQEKKYEPPRSLSRQASDATFGAAVMKAIDSHEEYVSKNNHGIKERNILRLLLPIGVPEIDLDPLWLGTMNSFGSLRGVVAHNSARRVQTPPDPATAQRAVTDALSGLLQIEPTIVALRRK